MKQNQSSPTDAQLIDRDIQAILIELASTGAWSAYEGPFSHSLSESLKTFFQRTHVQLCCSGTLATELALRGCRIGTDDEVLLSGYDFPGNFRAIEAVGASIAVVDIPLFTWSFSCLEKLQQAVGPKTKAVIVSHLHGTTAAMQAICEWAHSSNLIVIEDACQAPGAVIDGKPSGSWGDCSILSFGGSKLLSAGRGGAVLTNDPRIDQRIRIYRERGNDAFPLSELQAAVLGPQMNKLALRHESRSAAVTAIESVASKFNWIECPQRNETIQNTAFYKWGFQVIQDKVPSLNLRDFVITHLQTQGVAVGPGFHGFARRSATRCRPVGTLTNAEAAARSTILVHHTMLNQDLCQHFQAVDQRLHHENLIDE